MKIVNLMEDTPGCPTLHCEHGLSFYIETHHHKLLMDTGATDAFLHNAAAKGIDLTKVDTVIISHGHYDHTGGLLAFANLHPQAKIYIHENAVGEFYSCKNPEPKYIGMDPRIASLPQVVFTNDSLYIDEELSLFAHVTGRKLWARGNMVLKKKVGNTLVQDTFDHEQYLVVTEEDKSVLLSGCAHTGILNILERYKTLYDRYPTHVISGFHTVKQVYDQEDDLAILETAKELSTMPTLYYTGHCTGEYAVSRMQPILGDKLILLHSGDDIL